MGAIRKFCIGCWCHEYVLRKYSFDDRRRGRWHGYDWGATYRPAYALKPCIGLLVIFTDWCVLHRRAHASEMKARLCAE